MAPGGCMGHYVRHSHRTSPPLAAHERRRPAADGGHDHARERRGQAGRGRGRSRRRPDGARAPARRPVFATVGTITQIESAGELPNGSRALVIRGIGRARIGTGVPGADGALHVEVEHVSDGLATEATRALASEYRAIIEAILEHRGARRIADVLAERRRPRSARRHRGLLARPHDGAARRAARDDRRSRRGSSSRSAGCARCSPTSS